jgi:undecaprenyl-diphosphatase
MSLLPPEGIAAREARWCRRANRYGRRRGIRIVFSTLSRLGDGVFWYMLMGALVLADGLDGLQASVHMAITGAVALTLYKGLKRWTRRPRPFAADVRIRAWVAPLDEYSFPSGHTLHAVSFTVVALLVPFTAGVAMSRVVLGLHYPSDVLAATGIGLLLGTASLQLSPLLAG